MPGGAADLTAQSVIRWYKGRVHTAENVYTEMMGQIYRDFSVLPNPDKLTLADIVRYYNMLRPSLRAATKPSDG